MNVSSMIILKCYLRSNLRVETLQNGLNYFDLRLEVDEDIRLYTRIYDKRDDFDFPIHTNL